MNSANCWYAVHAARHLLIFDCIELGGVPTATRHRVAFFFIRQIRTSHMADVHDGASVLADCGEQAGEAVEH